MDDAARVRRLLRQQAALAGFGSFALRQTQLGVILEEAARICAEGLNVRFSKVCCYRPDENDLLIVAGCGWKAGVVGHVVSRADQSSPQGRAFVTGEPSICNELSADHRFKLPAFYAEHGIISTIDVVIKGADRPYGVLEIDSDERHDYDQHDVNFLTGFANVLAEAVATASRTKVLQATIDEMARLVADKDRLIEKTRVLAAELQHRVRNNLQLIYGMLNAQLKETADLPGQTGLKAIARRVSTLAEVYDHLLGTEMTRTTDFGGFVRSLCNSLSAVQSGGGAISLTCESEAIYLDLDVVTALGVIVAELVTNSYDHAFNGKAGAIRVEVRRVPGDPDRAVLTVADNGQGFVQAPETKRHGVGLVRRLAEQLNGEAVVSTDHGTIWTIKFPAAPAPGPASDAGCRPQ